MNRRELLKNSAALGVASAVPLAITGKARGSDAAATPVPGAPATALASPLSPLRPPEHGSIPVAFLISDGAVVIDFAGPWEVFANAAMHAGHGGAFRLYTVAETRRPITASSGMTIVPNFTIENAPAPRVIVIPAQDEPSTAVLDWIRRATQRTDVTMSVCTGAFVLAKTGLLSGKAATTHHAAYTELAIRFPDIRVIRGARFVEVGNLASSGGLSSGIDLALRVVGRYFGGEATAQTAAQMEYQGQGWMDQNSNQAYARGQASTAEHPLCPVCNMEVDPHSSPLSVYRGQTYYFCMPSHKELFDRAPERVLEAVTS